MAFQSAQRHNQPCKQRQAHYDDEDEFKSSEFKILLPQIRKLIPTQVIEANLVFPKIARMCKSIREVDQQKCGCVHNCVHHVKITDRPEITGEHIDGPQ